jgi:hypothetical protein
MSHVRIALLAQAFPGILGYAFRERDALTYKHLRDRVRTRTRARLHAKRVLKRARWARRGRA